MKLFAPLAIALIAAPAFAQTATDGTSLSSRIGPAFFSDDGMSMMRSPAEIQTGWDSLSPEDQGALGGRCKAIGVNFQADMSDSSGNAGSGVEPSTGTDVPPETEAAEQEPMTESGGDSGPGVEPSTGTDVPPETEAAEQEPTTESGGDSGAGVEPTEEMANEGFMADEAKLRAVCDAAAEL